MCDPLRESSRIFNGEHNSQILKWCHVVVDRFGGCVKEY